VDSSAPTKPATPANRKPTPAEARRAVKNQRKNSAREALRKQEAARRQRNAWLGALGAVVLIGAALGLIGVLHGSKAKPAPVAVAGPQAVPSGAASAAPSGAPSAAPSAAPYVPNIPAGDSAALKTQPVVKAGTGTVSKLAVTTLIQGTGAVIKKGDNITVQYVGVTYKDGAIFDSSWKDGQALTSPIGEAKLIAGWDDSIPGLKLGSRVQIDIPAAQAYGADGSLNGGGPAGDLRFVVDLLSDSGPATS
jgi:FKBP-type peptidyl-prolyl isomerase-like protein